MQAPLHAAFANPNLKAMDVHPFAINITSFHSPSLETVIGDSPRLDKFVNKHSQLQLCESGRVPAVIECDIGHLLSPHRYNVAVGNFSYLWFLYRGELIFNTSVIGG